MKWITGFLVSGVALILMGASVPAMSDSIPWSVMDSGGGHHTSASYQLDDSVGQPIIGESTGNGYILQAGFIYGLAATTPTTTTYTSPAGYIKGGRWNLFGLPADPANGSAVALLGGPGVTPTPLNAEFCGLQFWINSEPGGFQPYGSLFGWPGYRYAEGTLNRGTAYWLNDVSATVDRTISYEGYAPTQDFDVYIPPHSRTPYWIMVATPFPATVMADNVLVKSGAGNFQSWASAYGAGIIGSTAQGWSSELRRFVVVMPTAWTSESHQFDPWWGYWVLIQTGADVTIRFPKP